MVNVLYIRPPVRSTTGIRCYSDIVLEIMSRYCLDEFTFIDMSADRVFMDDVYDSFSMGKLRAYLLKMREDGKFDGIDLIMAEVGINEYIEFFTLKEIKSLFPRLTSFVTIHDPPRTVMNLNPMFSLFEKYVVARGIRRIFNALLGSFVEQNFFRQGHNYIVLSRKGAQMLASRLEFARMPVSDISYLPHVNFCDGSMADLRTNNGEVFTLGYLGFLTRHKGVDILVRAVEDLKSTHSVRLRIVGGTISKSDEKYLDNLKRYIITKGLQENVEFTGYLANEQIPGFLRNIDVMVLPYKKSDSGSASGPFMWARSLGIPVIASDTRAFPENIEHGTDGMLFDADRMHSLSDCLRAVMDNHELLGRLRKGALARKEECSHSITARSLSEVLMRSFL